MMDKLSKVQAFRAAKSKTNAARLLLLALFAGVLLLSPIASYGQGTDERLTVRVKDIAEIEGVRGNQLIGYGLVIGLNRTGDRVQQNLYARQTLQNLLERMGISTPVDTLKPENIATVLVTGTLPPFARQGSKIDVVVSSIGDARSLQGGTLVLTPLKGVDNQVYALAQGPLSIGGISAGGEGNSVEINHPTVGRLPNGAIVERAVATELAAGGTLTLALRQDDFTTASRLTRAVNQKFGANPARALDGRNIQVTLPANFANDRVSFIAELETLKLQTDAVAKVIINERTGTIVMGRDVLLSSVAISQGGITVRIGTEYDVSQPSVLSKTGETVTVPRTTVEVEERKPESVVLPDGASVDEVVRGLRAVGVSARDIISILQAIKAAGALAADLEMQ
ncbi:MAG TPA: flagellar basal body P-ring protein FlgI [Pyrinomonadaceae bacterium]|nr:flagellar basal body P-ring protein FlgI [Pyrinomonadaceae bacterium]